MSKTQYHKEGSLQMSEKYSVHDHLEELRIEFENETGVSQNNMGENDYFDMFDKWLNGNG